MALINNGIYSCDTSEVGTEAGKIFNGIYSIDSDADALENEGVCSVDGAKHTIEVIDGSGSGSYIEKEVIAIAPTITEGFLGWVIEGAGYIDSDGKFVVGNGNATITPVYEESEDDGEDE